MTTHEPYRGRGAGSPHYHRKPVPPIHWIDVVPPYRSGKLCREISKGLGVSEETVRRALIHFQEPRRKRGTGAISPQRNRFWKGGRRRISDRYWSRKIAAYCFGRRLPPGAVVHHVDERPQNNDPANLILFPSNAIHCRVHYLLSRLPQPVPRDVAIRVALENGGERLRRPPALDGWRLDTTPPVLLDGTRRRMPAPPGL